MASCQDPEYVSPTAERQGLTSLTAIFTSGPYEDKEAVKYDITDQQAEKYVIPVPWFYPSDSENETEQYMSAMRVQAVLAPNCKIEPALGVLDLTKDNYFTYTDAEGSQRKINITGQRVKSAECSILAFSIVKPSASGIIDNNNNTVSVVSVDDLSSCLAEITLSPHATISPDPRTTALDYNKEVKLTVTAHNGTDKKVYTVKKTTPEKIQYGFNQMVPLFSLDATSIMGFPWNATNAPTLGVVGGKLVVCQGDGTVPRYFNQETGSKEGEIKLGQAKAGCITSDEGGHLLICNSVQAGGECNVYVTNSVAEAPKLFTSFTNNAGLPMGAKMKVAGNINGDAVIIITNDGVAGVTTSSKFTRIVVKGGVPQAPEVVDISSTGLAWSAAPVNSTSVTPASDNISDGCFLSYYDANTLTYLDGNNKIAAQLPNGTGNSWALNQNNLDAKAFNNANYMALFIVSHFPHWGTGPQLYLYDVTNKSALAAADIASSSALVLKADALEWYQKADTRTASGDVVLAPTPDGYKLYVYYYDNNSSVIGAYVADCIKQ